MWRFEILDDKLDIARLIKPRIGWVDKSNERLSLFI
jgi:hypothetical protein